MKIPPPVNIALGRAVNWQPPGEENEEELLEGESQSGGEPKPKATPPKPGTADMGVGLRREASAAYDRGRMNLPQRRDVFGNVISAETQFGGGPDPNVRRFYDLPNEVGGGYFRSYREIADQLGHDPHVFTAAGGFIGRGSKAAGLSRGMQDLRNMADNPTLRTHMGDLTRLNQLFAMIRQALSQGGNAPMRRTI